MELVEHLLKKTYFTVSKNYNCFTWDIKLSYQLPSKQLHAQIQSCNFERNACWALLQRYLTDSEQVIVYWVVFSDYQYHTSTFREYHERFTNFYRSSNRIVLKFS